MQTVLNWHGYKVRNEDIRFGRLQPFRRRRENRSGENANQPHCTPGQFFAF